MKVSVSMFITCVIMAFQTGVFAGDSKVSYPEGYRNWLHVKSMLIKPGHPLEDPFQGIHHVYANAKAVKGLNDGAYSDGAVLVFDLLEYTEQDNAITEGNRKLTGVMYKDTKQYAKTGGWGFEAFAADSKTERLVTDSGASCFACHTSEKNDDYVFSKLRQ